MGVYAASKAYVLSFSEALACELADSQIKVSCVCPGPTKTEFNMRADMGEFKLPANVLATAESVAEDCLRISQKQQSKVKINGFFNQITMFLSKFAPRKAKTRAARDMMRKVAG
jgi:short-subunit dehydrogenase